MSTGQAEGSAASDSGQRRWLRAIPFALALASMLPFVASLTNDFVNLDDYDNLSANQLFRGVGLAQVRWSFRATVLGVYQPLAWVLFGVQYRLFGVRPWGYHLVSLLLHGANAVALYHVVRGLLRRCVDASPLALSSAAAGAVALFATHPLRTQVVVWASCQPYLPSVLFSLLALLAYLRADARPERRREWLALCVVLYAIALLFKAVAASVPALLLILDRFPLRRRDWLRSLVEKVPFAVVGGVFMAVAVRVRGPGAGELAGWTLRAGRASAAIWFYVGKTLWPLHLSPLYALPALGATEVTRMVLATLGVAAVTVLAIVLRRRSPALLAVWLAFVAILSPNLGLIPVLTGQVGTDRYTYFSSMALVAGLAGLLRPLRRLQSRLPLRIARLQWRVVAPAMVAAAMLFSALSSRESRAWRDSSSLWRHALANGGGSVACNGLGVAYDNAGDAAAAAALYRRALSLDSNNFEAHLNLASLLLGQRPREAAEHLGDAVRIRPRDGTAHYMLGVALTALGRRDEAIAQFRVTTELNPAHVVARQRLQSLLREGDRARP